MRANFKAALLTASLTLLGAQAIRLAEADEPAHSGPHAKASAPAGGYAQPKAYAPAAGYARPNSYAPPKPAYYPPVGAVSPSLPQGYRPYYHGTQRYYFNGGVWYAPRGVGFVVVNPPVGLVIAALPPYCSTLWIGGIPYYYADNVYYAWQPDQNGYAVVDPPQGADAPSPPPDTPQSKDQQAADQYECSNWATGQTGFDPTQPDGGAAGDPDLNRSNYDRAMTACLQARDYQVN
jgi:hypothetical protein